MQPILRHRGLRYVRGFKSSFDHLNEILLQASNDSEAILALQPRQQNLQSKIVLLKKMIKPAATLRSEILRIIQATVAVRNQLTLEILSS